MNTYIQHPAKSETNENNDLLKVCPNAKYIWHKVDGICKECQTRKESDAVIQARRTAKGYR